MSKSAGGTKNGAPSVTTMNVLFHRSGFGWFFCPRPSPRLAQVRNSRRRACLSLSTQFLARSFLRFLNFSYALPAFGLSIFNWLIMIIWGRLSGFPFFRSGIYPVFRCYSGPALRATIVLHFLSALRLVVSHVILYFKLAFVDCVELGLVFGYTKDAEH